MEAREREPQFEGGGEPVPDLPPDQPGAGRGAILLAIIVLGLLILLVPLVWAFGALLIVGPVLGTGGLVALWVGWGLCVLAFLWLIRTLRRRHAS